MNILAAARLALRVTTTAFDDQIKDLIDAALLDLEAAGITYADPNDALVRQAVVTYVRMHFGQPDDFDRLKASYDEQKAQMSTRTGYKTWEGQDGQID